MDRKTSFPARIISLLSSLEIKVSCQPLHHYHYLEPDYTPIASDLEIVKSVQKQIIKGLFCVSVQDFKAHDAIKRAFTTAMWVNLNVGREMCGDKVVAVN